MGPQVRDPARATASSRSARGRASSSASSTARARACLRDRPALSSGRPPNRPASSRKGLASGRGRSRPARPGARAHDRLARLRRERRRAPRRLRRLRAARPAGRHRPRARDEGAAPPRRGDRDRGRSRPGPQRVEAPCAHYPACGGCRFQDLAYDAQVATKEQWVADSLQRLAGLDRPAARADRAGGVAVPLPQQDGVLVRAERRRADARPAPGGPLGRGARRSSECWLTSDVGNAIRNRVREWAREEKLPAYDQETHEGYLRHLVRPRGPQHRPGARAARDRARRALRPRAPDRGADRVPRGALDPLVGEPRRRRGDEPADRAPLGRGRDRGGDRRPALPRAPERVPADEHRDGRAALRDRARVRRR